MSDAAYYNEFAKYPAAWLRSLAAEGRITPGAVDERSICDVQPADVAGATRAHFFAGIGGWDLALQIAGWPASQPVWTGSCPCQPFSSAGRRGAGFDDARHLWPEFFRLIDACRPVWIFGEQVASGPGLAWWDLVSADLGGAGYAVGAADLCAAGVGAPHIRQRLFWVAHCPSQRLGRQSVLLQKRGSLQAGLEAPGHCATDRLADDHGERRDGGAGFGQDRRGEPAPSRGMDHADRAGLEGRGSRGHGGDEGAPGPSSLANPWADAVWTKCRDGRTRPTQPGVHPLASRLPQRVGQIAGYGNSIVPQVAAAFIRAAAGCAGLTLGGAP